jgi:hypothetical protein
MPLRNRTEYLQDLIKNQTVHKSHKRNRDFAVMLLLFKNVSFGMEWMKHRNDINYLHNMQSLSQNSETAMVSPIWLQHKRQTNQMSGHINSSQATTHAFLVHQKSNLECGTSIRHKFWLWLSRSNMLHEMRCNVLFPQKKIFSYRHKLPSFKCLILTHWMLLWKTQVTLQRPGRWRAQSYTTNSRRHDYKGDHISYNKIGHNLQK